MAISTYNAVLKWGTSYDNAEKVVDIKDFPELFGDPNLLETTTLADDQQTNILGIKQSSLLKFTCNYTSAAFATCNTAANSSKYYVLELSDGSKFRWQGQHTLGLPGKGVDQVIEFTINIAASTVPEFVAATI
jgi:hypothetical protein